LKYCYTGAQVGEGHEFGVGNVCRQCGLSLGKPLDTIDFGKEGAAILAAQQGGLRIEVTQSAFNALSEAVRRRKVMVPIPAVVQAPWAAGLAAVALAAGVEVEGRFGSLLRSVLASLPEGPIDEIGRATLWAPVIEYMDILRVEVGDRIGPLVAGGAGKAATARAREAVTAMSMFDTLTEDPFIEGPRALQEYWCAKVQAAGAGYTVTKVTGAAWANLSRKHNELINKLVSDNSLWFAGDVTEGMRPVLAMVAKAIGPPLRAWIERVRPSAASAWTIAEAQLVLRTMVLEAWRDGLTTTSPMYATVASPGERESTAAAVANWTRALMFHVKQQYVRFSKETIKRILQDRAGLERDTIVEEFESIKDDDVRAAELLKKQFRIGRWAGGANLQKYDADTFEFESEQRKRMGIVDAPVDPILLEGAGAAAAAQEYGFGALAAGPEDGYDVGQGADGDDY
jgi:hypothetical protein